MRCLRRSMVSWNTQLNDSRQIGEISGSGINPFSPETAKEKIVGWYHTGPKLHSNDLDINEIFRRYNSNAVRFAHDAVRARQC